VAQREAEGRASVVLVFSHQDVNSALGQAEPGPPSASAHPPNVASDLIRKAIGARTEPTLLRPQGAHPHAGEPIRPAELPPDCRPR
jgi:hypothetical protein